MKYVFGLVVFVLGVVAGLEFPDIDQSVGLVMHRSILTHGPLVPLIVFAAASGDHSVPIRWLGMGVCLGVAVHLGFDLFPEGWSGYALISVPGYGRTPMLFSWAWIALSMAGCVYMAVRLSRTGAETAVLLAGLAGTFWWAAMDEEALWGPGAAVGVAAVVALIIAANQVKSAKSSRSA